jgi:hypothetical protein
MKESVRQKENVSATKKARTTKEEGGAGYERESRFDTEEVKESTTGSCVPFEVQTESKYLLGTQTTDGWIPVSSSLKSKPLVFHPSSVPNSPTVTHNHSLTSDPKVLFLVSHFVLSFSRNNAQAVRKIKIDKEEYAAWIQRNCFWAETSISLPLCPTVNDFPLPLRRTSLWCHCRGNIFWAVRTLVSQESWNTKKEKEKGMALGLIRNRYPVCPQTCYTRKKTLTGDRLISYLIKPLAIGCRRDW